MARYRKVDPRIWNDEKFRSLSDAGKLAFLFLLTHPHMTALGAMRATIGGLADELGWTTEAFREAFQEALSKGMAEGDFKAHLIALPNFTKYNSPESPNVIKAWVGALDLLPECSLKTLVIARSKAFAEGLGKAFAEALPEAFREALPKAMPNQEQEQEQEQLTTSDTDVSLVGKHADLPPCPTTEIIDLYHRHLPSNPRVKVIGKARQAAVKSRWREAATLTCKPFGYSTREAGLASWASFFATCAESDFLTGRTAGKDGKPPFVADLDFLVSPRGFTRTLENRYHRGQA